ncbi:hypothetical protein WJX72_005214 [[Myrmecia] bisecta]|uniref:Uncharacterized protein n=1 Tax=[Myrmecia] bisecta TaxID=41462 RepID=A0AAW1Q8W0_9CHLO
MEEAAKAVESEAGFQLLQKMEQHLDSLDMGIDARMQASDRHLQPSLGLRLQGATVQSGSDVASGQPSAHHRAAAAMHKVGGATRQSTFQLQELPDVLRLEVAMWLPRRDLCSLSLTCRSWFKLACSPTLWRDYVAEDTVTTAVRHVMAHALHLPWQIFSVTVDTRRSQSFPVSVNMAPLRHVLGRPDAEGLAYDASLSIQDMIVTCWPAALSVREGEGLHHRELIIGPLRQGGLVYDWTQFRDSCVQVALHRIRSGKATEDSVRPKADLIWLSQPEVLIEAAKRRMIQRGLQHASPKMGMAAVKLLLLHGIPEPMGPVDRFRAMLDQPWMPTLTACADAVAATRASQADAELLMHLRRFKEVRAAALQDSCPEVLAKLVLEVAKAATSHACYEPRRLLPASATLRALRSDIAGLANAIRGQQHQAADAGLPHSGRPAAEPFSPDTATDMDIDAEAEAPLPAPACAGMDIDVQYSNWPSRQRHHDVSGTEAQQGPFQAAAAIAESSLQTQGDGIPDTLFLHAPASPTFHFYFRCGDPVQVVAAAGRVLVAAQRSQHMSPQPSNGLTASMFLRSSQRYPSDPELVRASSTPDMPHHALDPNGTQPEADGEGQKQKKKPARSGPRSRTSCYLGVTRYKRTGRWEAHIWDSSDASRPKGRQIHLGSFSGAEPAAKAYDRAAVRIRGFDASLNFPDADYTKDPFLLENQDATKEEFVMKLRALAQASMEGPYASICKAPGSYAGSETHQPAFPDGVAHLQTPAMPAGRGLARRHTMDRDHGREERDKPARDQPAAGYNLRHQPKRMSSGTLKRHESAPAVTEGHRNSGNEEGLTPGITAHMASHPGEIFNYGYSTFDTVSTGTAAAAADARTQGYAGLPEEDSLVAFDPARGYHDTWRSDWQEPQGNGAYLLQAPASVGQGDQLPAGGQASLYASSPRTLQPPPNGGGLDRCGSYNSTGSEGGDNGGGYASEAAARPGEFMSTNIYIGTVVQPGNGAARYQQL